MVLPALLLGVLELGWRLSGCYCDWHLFAKARNDLLLCFNLARLSAQFGNEAAARTEMNRIEECLSGNAFSD